MTRPASSVAAPWPRSQAVPGSDRDGAPRMRGMDSVDTTPQENEAAEDPTEPLTGEMVANPRRTRI